MRAARALAVALSIGAVAIVGCSSDRTPDDVADRYREFEADPVWSAAPAGYVLGNDRPAKCQANDMGGVDSIRPLRTYDREQADLREDPIEHYRRVAIEAGWREREVQRDEGAADLLLEKEHAGATWVLEIWAVPAAGDDPPDSVTLRGGIEGAELCGNGG